MGAIFLMGGEGGQVEPVWAGVILARMLDILNDGDSKKTLSLPHLGSARGAGALLAIFANKMSIWTNIDRTTARGLETDRALNLLFHLLNLVIQQVDFIFMPSLHPLPVCSKLHPLLGQFPLQSFHPLLIILLVGQSLLRKHLIVLSE